ncbi:hypothetical protein TrRE_jg503, partial [Triparma retinervis]
HYKSPLFLTTIGSTVPTHVQWSTSKASKSNPAPKQDLYVSSGPRITMFKNVPTLSPSEPSKMEAARKYTFPSPVTSFSIRPSDGLILVGGEKGMLKVVNSVTKTTMRTFEGKNLKSNVTSTCWSDDGGTIFAGGDNGEGIWGNVVTGNMGKWKVGDGAVRGVKMGRWKKEGEDEPVKGFITGGGDGFVRVWAPGLGGVGSLPSLVMSRSLRGPVSFVERQHNSRITIVGVGKEVVVLDEGLREVGRCTGNAKTVTSGVVGEIDGDRGKNEGNDNEAFEVRIDKKPKLSAVTKAVKGFQYGKALTTALRTRNVRDVAAVTSELWGRDGLTTAVAGRTTEEVEEIFHFVCRYVCHPGYGGTVAKL